MSCQRVLFMSVVLTGIALREELPDGSEKQRSLRASCVFEILEFTLGM